MSQKTTSSPESKPSSANKSPNSPGTKSTLVNASGKGIRSSSSSSSGNNTRVISNAYTAEKSKTKIRSNSGKEENTNEQTANISTSPSISKQPVQVSNNNEPNDPNQSGNINGATKNKPEKPQKVPRKISNIETSKTEPVSDQSLKRANSYASSCKPNNLKSSPSNIAQVHISKLGSLTGKNDNSDTVSSPASKDLRTKNTARDSGFIDSNNGIVIEDNTTSALQRPASFHGAGRKQLPNSNTSTLKTTKQATSNERRKSCYAGSANEISTADLFSDRIDDSGFPRLSWKGEHSNPDLNDEESGGGGGGGRAKGGKGMGMGKGRNARRREQEAAETSQANILNMDPDASFRTHMLFPGPKAEADAGANSPTFFKMLTSGSIFSNKEKGLPFGGNVSVQDQMRYRDEDPFTRGKQVTFDNGDGRYSTMDGSLRPPERRPNAYGADTSSRQEKPPFTSLREPYREGERQIYEAGGTLPKQHLSNGGPGRPIPQPPGEGISCDPYMNGSALPGDGGGAPLPSSNASATLLPPGSRPPRRPSAIALNQESQQAQGGTTPNTAQRPQSTELAQAGPPKGPPRRKLTRDEMLALRNQSKETSVQRSSEKDCFIIPQNNLERFLPDGITLPRGPVPKKLINILEMDDPKLTITFHIMGPLTALTPHLESPLSTPAALHRQLAQEELAKAQELNATEGFLLKNMEKDSEYPYINYFVIQKNRQESNQFFRSAQHHAYDLFNPTKTGYSCNHTIDLYDESATIARPPVDTSSKKPVSDLTGYIICVYHVLKGDDGEKFERNWLYWTGARMLYKNLPKAVGLRRVTLHKSLNPSDGKDTVYLLLVECSHFMDHVGEAANLLPILRGRICGYTGIYRVADSF